MKLFKFNYLLKQTIWGGQDVTALKGLTDAPTQVGESWEISGVPGNETLVSEGAHQGQTLTQLIEAYGADLVGRHNFQRYGTTFPLLIKFISAAHDLSIQVHPDDAMAKRMGHPYGKTEMWYIIGTHPGASLCAGFNADFSADGYSESLANGTLMSHLCRYETSEGDCFFIPAGRIHSIGAGNLLIEIQQSSNDTFRVYDFDRTDDLGHKRPLHVSEAREALSYKALPDYRTHYEANPEGCTPLVDCEQFHTRLHQATAPFALDYSTTDSFAILIAYEGEATVRYSESESTTLKAGETLLVPASIKQLTVEPLTPTFKMLDTYC